MKSGSYEVGAAPLDSWGTTVSWGTPLESRPGVIQHRGPFIILQRAGIVDEGAFIPPCSIQVAGKRDLEILRDAISNALGDGDE